jgi:hypothetical protein
VIELVGGLVALRVVLPRIDGDAGLPSMVSLANGGNGCPKIWASVMVDDAGASAASPFGACSESA